MTRSIKETIRERAGIGATGNLYRGGDFEWPQIEADEVDIWYVEEGEEAVDDARPRSADDALTVVRTETREIAGGLSERIKGSEKFARSLSEVGVILVFDSERIRPRPEPIEYDLDWMDEHPGLLARIDTLSNGEIRSADTGEVLGLTWQDGGIHKGKRANLEHTATSPTYSEEREWFAYADTLHLEEATIGGVSVVHTKRAVGGSIQGALNEFEDYSMRGGIRTEGIEYMSRQEQAEALADEIRATSSIVRDSGLPYWLVVVEDDRNWASNGGIEPNEFILASTGETTTTDLSELPEWIPV